jgi:hypothetical protein
MQRPATERGRYWVSIVESGVLLEVGTADNRYAVMGRTTVTNWFSLTDRERSVHLRQWAGAAPATLTDRAAWQRAGSPTRWPMDVAPGCRPDDSRAHTAGPGPVEGFRSAPGTFDFQVARGIFTGAELRDLPADPVKLKSWLIETIRANTLDAVTGIELAEAVFGAVVNLLYQVPVTQQARAAAYGVLADLPGVRSLGTVTDPLGRTGVAFTITSNDTVPEQRANSGGPMQDRIVVDPDTGQPLSYESRALAPTGYNDWVPAGALFQYEAVVKFRWTDDQPPKEPHAPEDDFRRQEPCIK